MKDLSKHPAVEFFAAFGLLSLVGASPLEALVSIGIAAGIRAAIRRAQSEGA